jgi:RNA-directed DNA polymerase
MGLRDALNPSMILGMTYQQYEKEFRLKATEAGFSEHIIQKCLNYAKPLLENSLPVIYNTSNLAALVGYKKTYLKRAALYTSFFYRSFTIKKNNGGFRPIKEPLPSLKEIQIWILQNILYKIPVSRYAKAYILKRNLLENVKYHRNKDVIISLDIVDFFSNVNRNSIEKIFLQQGYSSNISNLLSKLCCCDEKLPQGAPTSPYLSNIYLIGFDDAISKFCNAQDIRYTRYADDLTFSGKSLIKERPIKSFILSIEIELLKVGLRLNHDKIKIMSKDQRQIVTGIVVNEIIQIPRTERKKIRLEVYYLNKFGLTEHLIRTENTKANYIKHLIGKINFALHINPEDKEMKKYKSFVQTFIHNDESIQDHET